MDPIPSPEVLAIKTPGVSQKMTTADRTFSVAPSDRVCAVVITFFPDADFPERLEKIATQVSHVIVVDNGTTGESGANLERALAVGGNVSCVRNHENLGVPVALNQGVRRALAAEACSWIITFDQDSLPAGDMVEKLLTVWKSHPRRENVMIAGPRTIFVDSTSRSDPAADPSWREVIHVITSGSLFPRQVFSLAGYFNEGLFIDYVDIEYCLRLRTLGYQVIEVPSAEMLHRMGRLEERFLLGEKVHPTHHPPLRRYYQFRNALLLHRQYRKSQRPWRRWNRIILLKILILTLLYERQRLRSFFQIMRGIFHGLAGKAGRHGEKAYSYLPLKSF
jgi:rhamnosyltransferase